MRTTNKTKIAFVTLFELTEVFYEISEEFNESLDSFFVVSTRGTFERLRNKGVDVSRLLNLSMTRREVRSLGEISISEIKAINELERFGLTFSSIIMMSRFYDGEQFSQLIHYMALCSIKMKDFFQKHGITWVITEPTNAIELLAYLVCKKLDMRYGHIEFSRFPSNRIMLFQGYKESDYYPLAPDSQGQSNFFSEAGGWLTQYRISKERPAYFNKQAEPRRLFTLFSSACRRGLHLLQESVGNNDINYNTFLSQFELYSRPLRVLFYRKNGRLSLEKYVDASQNERAFALYFLHVDPERSINVEAPFYRDQLEIIRNLRRALPYTVDLFVKDHPSFLGCQKPSFYRQLNTIGGATLIGNEYDSRHILKYALFAASISGTVAYEAALLNVPSIIFCPMYFRKMPGVYECRSYADLPDIVAAINQRTAIVQRGKGKDEEILPFLADIFKNSVSIEWDGDADYHPKETILSMGTLLIRAIEHADVSSPCSFVKSC